MWAAFAELWGAGGHRGALGERLLPSAAGLSLAAPRCRSGNLPGASPVIAFPPNTHSISPGL